MVSANGAVVDDDIPGPKGDCVPLDQVSVELFLFQGWVLPRLLGRCTFFTSNFFLSLAPSEPLATALPLDEEAEASFISTSAIAVVVWW